MPQNVYDLEITDMIKISEKKYINIEFKKAKASILYENRMNIDVILAKKNSCSETPKHIFEKIQKYLNRRAIF